MNSNDIIKQVYATIIKKQKTHCIEDGTAKTAVELGNDLIEVGQTWTNSFSNDGKIDDDEEKKMLEVFNAKVDKWIPNVSGVAVSLAYNGITFFGVGWKGLKYYLNKFWDLGL